jgi:hypothetical protein
LWQRLRAAGDQNRVENFFFGDHSTIGTRIRHLQDEIRNNYREPLSASTVPSRARAALFAIRRRGPRRCLCGKRRDYAMLQKVHGPDPLADDRRYSPPVVLSDRPIEMTNARLSC